ncbi:MAG: amino acid ABC transporter substrate-binding protein [Psychrilyobacter sp.]|uniref:amino acid ABC transporter substrate-binding protein n=1 Tax=Psychrilyobacter sp. TaxID=2586924 RepID=UPI003C74EDD6
MNKFKVLLLGILLGTLFIACGKEGAQKEVIRVGTSGGYYPFTYTENDELKGFDIDVWNEIGKRTGKDIEFKQAKFSGLFGMLDIGKIDTVSNQITITDKRLEKYNFSIPYVYSGAQFFVAKGNPKGIKGIEDLVGRRVATEVGTNFEEIVRGLSKKMEFETVVYNSGSLVKDVELGRVDTFMMDKVSIVELIKKNNLQIELLDKPVKYIANAFPFVKKEKNQKIMNEVNEALNKMRKDGTLIKISNKYFGIDITSN